MGIIADSDTKEIPITLSKTSGLTQNVQLITGSISARRMNLVQQKTRDSVFDEEHQRYELRLKVEKVVLNTNISLPMLNYFEELRNGIIATNIDPQLSHGVESLKAQLAKECNDEEDDEQFEMIILKNDGVKNCKLELESDNKFRYI